MVIYGRTRPYEKEFEMKKFLSVVLILVLVLLVMFGGLYYRYVNNTESPYDEIGITLNGIMPGPIRAWGCGKLRETFPNQLPPLGCAVEGNPTQWAE